MKNVVVTGSTKGIGHALATEFARLGHGVVVTGRTEAAVDEAVAKIKAVAPKAAVVGVPTDVTDFDSVQALWDRAVAELGRVDIWVNNAGLAISTKTIVQNDPSEVSAMVRTNMLGTMFGAKVAAAGMLSQGGGQIVNILGGGSDGKFRPGQAIYSSTKRGLGLFTEALTKELEGTNVTVGSVRPGILITDGFIRESKLEDPAKFAKQRKALNIIADPVDEVAPWIAGQILAKPQNGAKTVWLTNGKIARRFAMAGFNKRDLFTRYGL
jgi:NAD(P)-dependent dehydrogenase (short-subunit alcohol dehydrogenase family)